MKKKILFIVNVDWFFFSHRLPIAIEAKKKGFEVHIATSFVSKKKELSELGFYLHELRSCRKKTGLRETFLYLLDIFFLIKHVSPSIVHLITIKPILVGSLVLKFFSKIYIVISISGLGYVFSSKGFFPKFRRFLVTNSYKLLLRNKKQKIIVQNTSDLAFLKKILKINDDGFIFIPGSGVDLNLYKPKPFKNNEIVFLFGNCK